MEYDDEYDDDEFPWDENGEISFEKTMSILQSDYEKICHAGRIILLTVNTKNGKIPKLGLIPDTSFGFIAFNEKD
jgi:hypothetical protein